MRRQARAWHAAEAIDAATLAAIEAAHPDDRLRLGPSLRALVAVFTIVAAIASFGILTLLVRGSEEELLLLFGLALLVLTEVQIGPLRRCEAGAEAATALLGLLFVTFAIALLSDDTTTTLLALLVLGAAMAWHWGYALSAAAATFALFGLLARIPGGRFLWIAAGLALPPFFLPAGDAARLPPSLRNSARAVAAVALLALYVAVHLGSWDHGIVEDIGGLRHGSLEGPLRIAFIAGTALVPLGVLVHAVRTRRSAFLTLGVLLALASCVTLRFYVHVAPLWVVLSAGGLATVALGLALRRFLHAGPSRERGGFTAEPLFDRTPGRGVAEIATALASFAPAPQAVAPQDAVKPGGGRYGGGGASGTF